MFIVIRTFDKIGLRIKQKKTNYKRTMKQRKGRPHFTYSLGKIFWNVLFFISRLKLLLFDRRKCESGGSHNKSTLHKLFICALSFVRMVLFSSSRSLLSRAIDGGGSYRVMVRQPKNKNKNEILKEIITWNSILDLIANALTAKSHAEGENKRAHINSEQRM